MIKNSASAIGLAMCNEHANELIENALEELRLRSQLPQEPSEFMLRAGLDPLKEIRDIIQARIDMLQQERNVIIGKYK
ncbi:hypothetical protein [Paenibacillus sp. YIM B09110]|uniref:hypothetical protein n=1 Tax=Paenibacillus sp. YIM B09110 TaxID=3126102 RepID=UPI00301CE24E